MLCIYTFYNYTKLCRGGGLLNEILEGCLHTRGKTAHVSWHEKYVRAGVHKLSKKSSKSPTHSRRQKGYTNQATHWVPTIFVRLCTVFCRPGDLAQWICVLLCKNIFLFAELMRMYKFSHVKIVFEEGKGKYIHIYLFISISSQPSTVIFQLAR